MANQHIIELNGKRFDALTGKVVAHSETKSKPQATQQQHKGTVMDGFTTPQRRSHQGTPHPATGIHTKAQGSKTLMRKGVKKPHAVVKQPRTTSQHHSTAELSTFGIHPASLPASPQRVARAQQIHQSKLISKFSSGAPRAVGKPGLSPLHVTSAPGAVELGRVAAQASTEPFHKAIENATSHQQPKLKKSRFHHRVAKKLRVSPHVLSVGSAALAVLLIGGFIAYQNVPNLAMRVASTRAGVHASLPGYKPAGFGFTGPIQYKPGQITVSFKSNSDQNRNFSITQTVSSWNSQTLLENFVAVNGQQYQTFEAKGKTIYIYGGSNATWVDGGIWYNVEGNSSLNTDQLLRLADSM